MKLCIECRHYAKGPNGQTCRMTYRSEPSPVDGEPRIHVATCLEERTKGACGEKARNWAPRPKEKESAGTSHE